MDSLDNFILKKKDEIKEIKGNKKWIKQSEIEKRRNKEIETFFEQETKKRKIQEYEKLKNLNDTLESKSKTNEIDKNECSSHIPISNKHIVRLLREFKEPIRLFGETDYERYKRLEELNINKNELKITRQNVFGDVLRGKLKEDALDLFEDEPVYSIGADANKHPKDKIKEKYSKSNKNEGKQGTNQLEKEDIIYEWIKNTMQEWNEEIEQDKTLDANEKKVKKATYVQTYKDLKPLERKLKQRTLDLDVRDKLYNVIDQCKKRNFKEAHDAYMLLAIGNAAWPMGVTMVGIHERAGRSKIFASEVAHILNDETTRKYIQMVKRLLSFCQRKYCIDHSRAVKLSTTHI